MRVIFEKSFLTEISKLGNTIKITSYLIGTYHTVVNKISELFNESYLTSDLLKTGKYELDSIWEEDRKNLKISINIPENEIDKISENSYNLIYCYYKSFEDDEKIAFILTGEINKNEDNILIDNININLSKNLINVSFPENTLSNILTETSDDTNFLEGPGINIGKNIFIDEEDNNMISKKSYYKYIRNIKSSGTTEELPFLNPNGERVYNSYKYTTVSKINIKTNNSKQEDNILIDDTLDLNGGELYLLGDFDYKIYSILNETVSEIKVGTADLSTLINYEVIVVNDYGLKFDYDYSTGKLKYHKNLDNSSSFSDILIRFSYYVPNTNKVSTIDSNTLRLSQGKAKSDWEVITDTIYKEDGKNLYLFSSKAEEEKTFRVKTNLNLEETEINLSTSENISEYFSLEYNKKDGEIEVKLKTKKENNDDSKWYPIIEGNSKLVKCILTAKDYVEEFYCVQSRKFESIDLFSENDSSFQKLDSIELTKDNGRSLVIYPAKITSAEDDNDYWKIVSSDYRINLTPIKGILNDNEQTDWGNGGTEYSNTFILSTNEEINSIYDINFENLIIARVNKSYVDNNELDLTDWKIAVNLGRLEIPVILKGDDPQINTSTDEIIFDKLGVYRFFVKSNCPFKIEIKKSDDGGEVDKYVFYDTDNKIFTSDDYNLSTGIPIYLKKIKADYSQVEGDSNIRLEDLVVETINELPITKTIKVYQKPLNPVITKISPLGNDTFINNSGELRINCNKSVSVNISNSGDYNIISSTDTILERVDDKETRGYLYTKIDYSISEINEKYPAKFVGKISMNPDGSPDNIIYYNVFQKGNSPKVSFTNTSTNNNIYLKSDSGDYVDILIDSIYPITINDITKDQINESFGYTIILSEVEVEGRYSIRIRTSQENTGSISEYLGSLTITSRIKVSDFLDTIIPGGDTYTQEEVDNIAGISKLTIYLYQYGINSNSPEYSGDVSTVKASGEFRAYDVINTQEFSVEFTENLYTNTTFDQSFKRVNVDYFDVIKDYIPIELSENEEDYIKYSRDRQVGFNSIISSNGEEFEKSIKINQSGYKNAIIYKDSNINETIFIGTNSKNIITKQLGSESTELIVNVGLFDIDKKLNPGDIGTNITISSSDAESSNYQYTFISINPELYGENNLRINFPKNSSITDKTRSFDIKAIDSYGETHTIKILITQTKKVYVVNSSTPTGSIVKYHSSGHCMQTRDIDVLDSNLETNIPQEKIIMKSKKDIGFRYEVTYIGAGTSGIDYGRYKITSYINPNKTNLIVADDILLGYNGDDGNFISIWTGKLRQGYLYVSLKTPDDKIIPPGGIVGSEENPYVTPGNNSGELIKTRVIFSILAKQREVNEDGSLGEEITIDPNDCKINGEPGSSQVWFSPSGSVSKFFQEYESVYFSSDSQIDQSKWPFLEHTYTTRESYYKIKIPLQISLNLFIIYSDINENSSNFFYKFFLEKGIAEDPYLRLVNNPVKISSEGGKVRIQVETNVVISARDENPGWISRVPEEDTEDYIVYNVDENLIAEKRTTVVTIYGGDLSVEATIEQEAAGPILIVEPNEFNINSNEGSIEFDVTSNLTSYVVEIDSDNESWINKNSIGTSENHYKFDISENIEVTPRTGKIYVKNTNLGITKEVTVNQKEADTILIITPDTETITVESEKNFFQISITSNTEFNITIDRSWISIDEEKSSEEFYYFNIDKNNLITSRTGVVTINTTNGLVTKTINVLQLGQLPNIVADPDIFNISSESTTIESNITYNLSYNTEIDVFWITPNNVNRSSGILRFNVEKNTDIEERSGTIKLTGIDVEVEELITVNQEGQEPYLNILPGTEINVPSSVGKFYFTVDSNISYEIVFDESSVDWIIKDPEGTVDNTYSYIVRENTDITSRNVNITVTSDYFDDKIITITQDAAEPILEVSEDTFSVGVGGGNVEFNVITNIPDYTVSLKSNPDDSWIIQEESTEDNKLIFTVNENTSIDQRTATVTLSGMGLEVIVNISQPGSDPKLEVNPTTFQVENTGEEITFEVVTNVSIEESINVNWITKKEGANYTYTISSNPTIESRTGIITLSNSEYELLSTITINQEKGIPSLIANPDSFETTNTSGTIESSITSNIDYTVNIPEETDWITKNLDSTDELLKLDIKENTTVNPRLGKVTLLSENYPEVVEEITINQTAGNPKLEVNPTTFQVNNVGEEITFEVVTNVPIEESINVDWITKKEGANYTYTVDPNLTINSRTGIITLSNSEYELLSTITINQEKGIPSLIIDPDIFNINSKSTTIESNITSNINYTINIPEEIDWITKNLDSTNELLKLDIKENNTINSRTGVVTLTSSEAPEINKTITINQEGEEPSIIVTPESFEIDSLGKKIEISVNSNIEFIDTIENEVTWITKDSITSTNNILYYDIAENIETTPRTGTITISGTGENSSINKIITITQSGKTEN